jgi:hypothetical protein
MTTINPFAFTFMLLMGLLIITLPRKFVITPFIICTLFMTMGQRLIIMDFNFTILRILLAIGWLRVIIRRDIIPVNLNILDKVIIWWGLTAVITGLLLDMGTNNFDNLQHRSGQIYTILGLYFLFKLYINDVNDIRRIMKTLTMLIIPLALIFLVERISGKNIFYIFGAVPEMTAIRDGRMRCQGPFAHPILAGTLGATLMPLCVMLWFDKGKNKFISLMGTVSTTVIMITSASSGPLLAYLSALLALFAWPLRNRMRFIRWSFLLSLITLHMLMKAPVWYLIGRISNITGGTGWGRAELIDIAIKHLNEWWLIGTTNTSHWDTVGVLPNPNMMDITNQYILEGVYGGLGRMIFFIMIIVVGFRGIGNAMNAWKSEPASAQFLFWSLGASLFAHVLSFISVAYFDQLILVYCLLLAMISRISGLPAPDLEASQPM